MKSETIEINNMPVHFVKTKRFKNIIIDIIINKKIKKEDICKYRFLSYMMSECSYKYPTKKLMTIEKEELYQASFSASAPRKGNYLSFCFSLYATNPNLINDEKYPNELFKYLYEVIKKPNVIKKAFSQKSFDIIKNYMKIDIESINEDPLRIAFHKAIDYMDSSSISSANFLGTLEDLDKITPESLYETYEDLVSNNHMEVFISGKFKDKKEILTKENIEILKSISNNVPKTKIKDVIVNNTVLTNPKTKEEQSNFLQTQLVALFNTDNLTVRERELVLPIFNYIYGSGGLKCKLYDEIREKRGYCYVIGSSFLKYDNLFVIDSSLKKENVYDTINQINILLKDMVNGNFTNNDIKDAKQSMLLSLNYQKESLSGKIHDLEVNLLIDNYGKEKKIKLINSVTKKEIMEVAKKIIPNTNFILSEAQNENI